MNKQRGPARLTDLDVVQRQCLLDETRASEAHGMLDDLEARCGMNVSALRAILPARSKLREVLGKYVNCERISTGGGCEGYSIPCDDGGHLLITEEGGCELPPDDAQEVACGRYDWEVQDVDGGARAVPVDQLEAWIDEALGAANAHDYWQQIALNALSETYQKYCEAHGWAPQSADELATDPRSAGHRPMLAGFIRMWEHIEGSRP